MMRAAPGLHRRTIMFAGANLVLAALAIWPWLPAPAPQAPFAPPGGGTDGPALASLPPLADFAATIERPLFAPSRRPAAGPAAQSGSAIERRYRLQGLVIAGAARHALILDTQGGRTIEIAEGGAIEGWVVKRIEQAGVVLVSPAGEATLTLAAARAAAPPSKP